MVRRVLLVLGVAVLFAVVPFLSGLLGALMLFVITRHLHDRLARHVPRRVSAFAICVAVFGLLLLPGTWLASTIIAELTDVLRSWQSAAAPAWTIQTPLGRFDVANTIASVGSNLVSWLSGRAITLFGSVTSTVLNLFIALFGLYYLLIDGAAAWRRIERIALVPQRTLDHFGERFASVTEALLLGTGVTALLQGTVVGVGFALVGFPSPVLWGFVTACASILPLFGSALVWLPGVAVLLLEHRTGAALVLAALGAGVASNVDNLARLVVYRRVSGIHPMLTLVGAFAGLRLFGVIGAFLGPLVLSYFVELIDAYEGPAPLASERLDSSHPGAGGPPSPVFGTAPATEAHV